MKYIYTNSQHSNPLCRIMPIKGKHKISENYDKEKYVEMILDAAETVLGYFGFDRIGIGERSLQRNKDGYKN